MKTRFLFVAPHTAEVFGSGFGFGIDDALTFFFAVGTILVSFEHWCPQFSILLSSRSTRKRKPSSNVFCQCNTGVVGSRTQSCEAWLLVDMKWVFDKIQEPLVWMVIVKSTKSNESIWFFVCHWKYFLLLGRSHSKCL